MGDKSVKDRTWSGALPTLKRPSGKTLLEKGEKNKKDNGLQFLKDYAKDKKKKITTKVKNITGGMKVVAKKLKGDN